MVRIRQARKEDLDQVINLRLRLVKNYPDAYLSTYKELQKLTLFEWEGWFFRYLRGGRFRFWVAEDKGRLVGMVACKGADWKRGIHVATVLALGVLPSHKGQGVGRVLMKKLIAWAKKETKIHRLQLDVYRDNQEAISLYRKLGFKKEGVRKKYAQKKDGTYQDSLTMALFF